MTGYRCQSPAVSSKEWAACIQLLAISRLLPTVTCHLSSVTCHLFSQLRPQRHHRIQLGGLAGRIDAEEDARGRGHEQAQQHAPQLHAGGETYDERYQLGHGHSAEYADDSPHQRHGSALDEELQQHVALPCAQRLAHADLARPLGHAHQHDVHNHDAAHYQRDGGDADHHVEEDRGELFPEVQEGIVGFDLEVVRLADRVVAAGAHQHPHLVLGPLHRLGIIGAGASVDVYRVIEAVGLLVGGDGHGHPVVLRLAQHLALAVAHAHDGVRDAAYPYLLAEGVAVAQQVVHNVVTHNDVVGRLVVVGGGKAAA